MLYALLALILLLLQPLTVLAVHECGAPHEKSGAGNTQHTHGCAGLRTTDFFYGDPRADAPELAARGEFAVGVRSVEVIHPDQLDILQFNEENPEPRYNRPLTFEIWYPAKLQAGETQITTYQDVLGHGANNPERPNLPFAFGGRAARDAEPLRDAEPRPMVIVSHGYSGSRVLLTWLTENLASKGYIVVAIDHTESTHGDAGPLQSSLVHRPRDINFALQSITEASLPGLVFMRGLVDAQRTAVIGYSMGTYGALSAAGVGVSKAAALHPGAVPGGHLAALQFGNPQYHEMLDSRIVAQVLFAPYAPAGFWSEQGVAQLSIPTFIVVGSEDQTTGFSAAQRLFDQAVSAQRYMLVYLNAIHEVAPNPAPPLAQQHFREYIHYQEPAWDNRRLNNINQHFITAFLGVHLQHNQARYAPYLDIPVVSSKTPRTDMEHPDYWRGFLPWTAIGMELHRREPVPANAVKPGLHTQPSH